MTPGAGVTNDNTAPVWSKSAYCGPPVCETPGFEVWTQGEPLDVAAFLRTPSGKPKNGKKLGTKRDAHGMVETIADALRGVVYPDDRQVDAGSWERKR